MYELYFKPSRNIFDFSIIIFIRINTGDFMEIMQFLTEISANGMDALDVVFRTAQNLMAEISSANVPEWFPLLCSLSLGTALLFHRR